MTEYSLKVIRQTRGPKIRFNGKLIASDYDGPLDLEIWQSEGGALIPVTIGEMRGQDDVRAEVIESPTLDGSSLMLDREMKMRDKAMHFAVMDFFNWDNRARSMVKEQLGWNLVREVA